MAVLKLYEYPHPILRQKCEKVSTVDDEMRLFLDNMLETMYADKGCGLAAPQVGVSKRVVVLDYATEDDEERKPMFPDQRADVERFEKVRVHFIDYHGQEQEVLADGLLAIILQHEIDHLDGILYIDHLSRLKRERLLKKLEKYRENREEKQEK